MLRGALVESKESIDIYRDSREELSIFWPRVARFSELSSMVSRASIPIDIPDTLHKRLDNVIREIRK